MLPVCGYIFIEIKNNKTENNDDMFMYLYVHKHINNNMICGDENKILNGFGRNRIFLR